MATRQRIGGILGGTISKKVDLELSPDMLKDLGRCIVKSIIEEAKKDFAKRGWSLEAHDGSPPLHRSFRVKLRGDKTIEITSTFPMMKQMLEGIPSHRMEWATQEAKDKNPEAYELTQAEKDRGMKKMGRVSKGERLPLVIPMQGEGGTVVFRMAPLNLGDAWVHPGVAKFTFLRRGIEKGRQRCIERIKKEIARQLGGKSK